MERKVIKGWLWASFNKIEPIQSVRCRRKAKQTIRINSSSFRICLTY